MLRSDECLGLTMLHVGNSFFRVVYIQPVQNVLAEDQAKGCIVVYNM